VALRSEIPAAYGSCDELLEEKSIKAVFISLPLSNQMHMEQGNNHRPVRSREAFSIGRGKRSRPRLRTPIGTRGNMMPSSDLWNLASGESCDVVTIDIQEKGR
jgi:hypothetical protein